TPTALRSLGLLAVSRVMSDRPLPLREVYSGPDARVYANDAAVPRAFVVGAEQVTDDQLAAVTAPSFDPRRTAVVSAPQRISGTGRAAIVTDEDERVVVRANANGRALLVLADTWFPGWKARVDGRPAPIVRTDQLLRGVVVGAGTHTVEFK